MLNKKQKRNIGIFSIIVLSILSLIFIKYNVSKDYFILLIYLGMFILTLAFEDDVNTIIFSIFGGLLLLTIIFIIILWISQNPLLNQIPLLKNGVTNEIIIALFTIVLTISTVFQLVTYRKEMVLNRLTILNASLDDELFLKIKNIGEFPATRIRVEIDRIDRFKADNIKEFWRNIKNQFWESEQVNIPYLEPQKDYTSIEVYKFLKKYYREINCEFNDYSENRKISSTREINTRLRVKLFYFTDIGDKAPVPLLKIFKIKINQGVEIQEIR